MNRAALISGIRDTLNRPDLSDDTIGWFIAMAEGRLNRALRDHPRNLRRATYTQPAGNGDLPLPVDILQLVELRQGSTQLRQFGATARAAAQAFNASFIACGNCLELFPAPAEDTEYTLYYNEALPPLLQAADENWVSIYFPDIYLYAALVEACTYLKDDARLGAWESKVSMMIDSLQAQGWNQNIGAVPVMLLGDD